MSETSDLEKQPRDQSVIEDNAEKSGIAPPAIANLGEEESNIVDWDGEDDPANPMNWSSAKKHTAIVLASAVTFVTPFTSSVFAPGVPELLDEFDTHSDTLSTFVVSVYLLGFVVGPFITAPASEIWGRLPIYHVSNVLFVIFTIICGVSKNMGMFCAFRFLQGAAGVTPVTNGGATIGDVVEPAKRGLYMAIWGFGPLLGPSIGPVVGGFLSQTAGWRWTFWLVAIISGILTLLAFIFMRETYAPVLLERKTRRLRAETGNVKLRSRLDSGLQPRDLFVRAFMRPMKLMFLSPIVTLLALMASVSFAYVYLLYSTYSFVFPAQYGFNAGETGLTFLGVGVGLLIGLPLVGRGSDILSAKLTAKNGGEAKPEYRLYPLMLGPWLLAAGLFGYGWTAQKQVHWIAPILLSLPIGVGQIATFLPVQNYMVDAFGLYAASAIAATAIMRSLFGAFIPLAAQSLYNRLGLGWGNSLLAFIALATAPIPFFFVRYGQRIRERFAVEL